MGDLFLFLVACVILIIQVILIVRFFKLCKDVAMINQAMVKVESDTILEHNKHKLFGHPDRARAILEDYIWNKFIHLKKNYNPEGRKKHYEQIKMELEPKLIEVGGSWPDIKIEDF